MHRIFFTIIFFVFAVASVSGQVDRKYIRSGNRAYQKGEIENAEIDYRRALEKDSGSLYAKYNLGNLMHKKGNNEEALKMVAGLSDSTDNLLYNSGLFHNMGNYALGMKNYKEAIEFYKSSLRINPSDMETKSNLAYAQKMLKDEQENQDQNQDQDQDQEKDKENEDQDDEKDDNKKQDQNKDQQDENKDQPQPKISPQTAQQMLQAIQNKEKETQEKVKKEKAKILQEKQKEKNW